tara:strand:+ start:2438 stop:3244 length:807 start_codon:yes stop_codon:yes gene_type:complete
MRVGILGGGFMGEAFIKGLLRANISSANEIVVAEISQPRRSKLLEYGVRLETDLKSACIDAELVLIALKPQDLEAIATLRGEIAPSTLLVSIAAGTPLSKLQQISLHKQVVRVMPNLPAAIGEGAAVYLAAPEVTEAQRILLHNMLEAVATVAIEAVDDQSVDLATALHGSGPAYVYLIIEALVDAATELGMARSDATTLVLATVAGSARYAIESGSEPAELRKAVTSPGGTTAAALAEIESAGVRSAFSNAVNAAFQRANELAENGD